MRSSQVRRILEPIGFLPALLVLLVPSLLARPQSAHAKPLEEIREEAARRDLPVLLMIGAEWCPGSQAFRDAIKQTDFVRRLEAEVVWTMLDGESGPGLRVAQDLHVGKYPTFVLEDAEGRLLDRWYGFRSPDGFFQQLEPALADPIPLPRRESRFRAGPNAPDARKLGEMRYMEGHYAEAVAYYRQARRLDPASTAEYERLIFGALLAGAHDRIFLLEEVREEAERILASPQLDPVDYMKISSSVVELARTQEADGVANAFVRRAVEASADWESPKAQAIRARLLPDYALHVEGDADGAMAYLEAAQPAGWEEDAYYLNIVAWWCFQNRTKLAQGEEFARRGVALARPGIEKANVLDTLAEIVHLRGDTEEAVSLIEQAIAEAPENEYFQRQLERFRVP